MDENTNNDRMQQQPSDAQRQQAGQQNQQGERDCRPDQRQEGRDAEGVGDGLSGGVDDGSIQPGRTGDGGAER